MSERDTPMWVGEDAARKQIEALDNVILEIVKHRKAMGRIVGDNGELLFAYPWHMSEGYPLRVRIRAWRKGRRRWRNSNDG